MNKVKLSTIWLLFFVTIASALISMPKELSIFGRTLYRPEFDIKLGNLRIQKNLDLKYGLDLAGGSQLVFEADVSKVKPEELKTSLASLKDNIERRVNMFGVSESTVQLSKQGDSNRLVVELPGVENVDQAVDLIGQTARLEFKGEKTLAPEATSSATFGDVFADELGLNGSHLQSATVTFDNNNGQPVVALKFNPEGTKLFAKATSDYLNKRIAIFLDNVPVTYPTVNNQILDGNAIISGGFTSEDAKLLATQLNAGALPVPIKLIAQTQIGGTLGKDTIQKGVTAGVVGIVIVAAFMILNYGRLGAVAVLVLAIYTTITIALYKLIPVTLTFPGIVGLLLSIGMALDSNILIFARLKEELRAGRPWGVALELAFGKAWDAIKDANICTIITGLILFNPFNWQFLNSSGMVRGFAVTLLLGIFVSLFTGVLVTRNLLRLFFPDNGKLKK